MATAYDTYAAMREQGRVGVVKFAAGEAGESVTDRATRCSTGSPFFVTHYDDVVATLLDDRFSVDPRSRMTPEQREQMPEAPEEFRPLAAVSSPSTRPITRASASWSSPASPVAAWRRCARASSRSSIALLDRAEREAAERGRDRAEPADGADPRRSPTRSR